MAKDKFMREKIFMALKDKKNGSIGAIYKRIQKYGTPFKTLDKRRKYPDRALADNPLGLSRQTVHNRIKNGWTIEQAMNTPLGQRVGRRKKND